MELGGVLLASDIRWETEREEYNSPHMSIARKHDHPHGLGGDLIHVPPARSEVILVDDVATSGSTLLRAAKACWGADLIPVAAIVVVDRQDGAAQRLHEEEDVDLHSLCTLQDIRYLMGDDNG